MGTTPATQIGGLGCCTCHEGAKPYALSRLGDGAKQDPRMVNRRMHVNSSLQVIPDEPPSQPTASASLPICTTREASVNGGMLTVNFMASTHPEARTLALGITGSSSPSVGSEISTR